MLISKVRNVFQERHHQRQSKYQHLRQRSKPPKEARNKGNKNRNPETLLTTSKKTTAQTTAEALCRLISRMTMMASRTSAIMTVTVSTMKRKIPITVMPMGNRVTCPQMQPAFVVGPTKTDVQRLWLKWNIKGLPTLPLEMKRPWLMGIPPMKACWRYMMKFKLKAIHKSILKTCQRKRCFKLIFSRHWWDWKRQLKRTKKY